jgi:hypothetical protein
MKNTLLLFVVLFSINLTFAQNCVPDPIAVSGGVAGLHPNATINPVLEIGIVSLPYNDVITVIVPSTMVVDFSSQIGFPVPPVTVIVNYFTFNTPLNLNGGLTSLCEPASCQILGGANGCMSITGTPTTEGSNQVNISGVYNVSVPASVPLIGGTSVDVPYVTSTYTLTVITSGVGIEESSQNKLNIFPNPSKGDFSIEGDLSQLRAANILSLEGKIVQILDCKELASGVKTNLKNGIYFIQLISQYETSLLKIIIE